MSQSPIYFDPVILSTRQTTYDAQAWSSCVQSYKAKQYDKCFEFFMQYLQISPVSPGKYVLDHGSAKIHITQDKDSVEMKVPFLKLPEGGAAIAMMRKLTEMNSQGLSRIKVVENDCFIIFKEDLSHCHPDKLMSVLKEIAIVADDSDDLFIKQFGAKAMEKATTEPCSAIEIDKAKLFLKHHWEEIYDLFKQSERVRSIPFLSEIIYLATQRLEYVLKPQGILRSLCIKARNELTNFKLPPEQILQNAKNAFNKIRELDDEALNESLYRAKFSIPMKFAYHEEDFCESIEKDEVLNDIIPGYINQKRFEDAVMYPLVHCYWLLNNYDLPQNVEDEIQGILKKASTKPWPEAVDVLMEGFENLKEGSPAAAAAYPEVDLNEYYKMAMNMAKKFMK